MTEDLIELIKLYKKKPTVMWDDNDLRLLKKVSLENENKKEE